MSGWRGGMTVSEAEIMDLWDAGWSQQRIACETRYSYAYVRSTVSNYESRGEMRVERESIRSATAMLGAALAAYVGPPT